MLVQELLDLLDLVAARDAVEVGLQVARAGAAAVLYTDIGRDGMRSGPNLEATGRLARRLERGRGGGA